MDVFPHTATIENDRLFVGGCDTTDLAERFGTPVVVFDRATFTERARAFSSPLPSEQIYYAGKAFCCVAVCELLRDLGLGLDVCTGGELATALAAGFPPARIIFHGNNKSATELRAASDAGVGRIVVDSFEEIERIAQERVETKLLVRITPGVEAHTHEFVQTGQEDSKFGFTLANDVALEALRKALRISDCEVAGVHAHIGSQIFELAAFDLAVKSLAVFLDAARSELGFDARELNLGGGFGIAHTEDEIAPDPEEAVRRVQEAVEREFAAHRLPLPAIFLEPGRALVGSAGITLYRVGTVKRIPGVRTYIAVDGGMSDDTYRRQLPNPEQTDRVYVSVDGGMSDNPRYPLYGARYEAYLANRIGDPAGLWTTVAGKHCESGDILIKEARLPKDVRPGDLLAIPATGAYTYSMASNYNRVPRPPVVMVEDGKAVEIIARETHLDLLRLDRHLDGTPL